MNKVKYVRATLRRHIIALRELESVKKNLGLAGQAIRELNGGRVLDEVADGDELIPFIDAFAHTVVKAGSFMDRYVDMLFLQLTNSKSDADTDTDT